MTVGTLVEPGDLLIPRSTGWMGAAIRLGAAIRDKPNLGNHVAVVHHTDKHGVTWCLEGRPGGVGWRNAADYLTSPWTLNNVVQPKTTAQRKLVCDIMIKMVGTAYDWDAIAMDAMSAFGIPLHSAWDLRNGQVPGHVVCSSAAQYAYRKAGLAHPSGDRLTAPADWISFVIRHGYNRGL